MLKLKQNLILLFLVLLISGFISGCGGGDSDSEQTTAISGHLIAGPVNGAIVTAYKLNADGTQGDEIGASDPTGEDGYYSISNPDYTGPVFIKAVGGTYTDEATGTEDTNLNSLTATAYIDTLTATISITPLTDIAKQLMDEAILADTTNVTMSETLINEKNSLVAEQLGLMQISDNANPIDIISVQPDDITNSAVINKSLDDEKLYALALAGISQNQENDTTNTINTLEKIIPVLMNDLKNNSELSETYQKSFSAGVSGYITDKQIKITNNNNTSISNPIIDTIIKNNVADDQFLPTANAGADTEVIEKGRDVSIDGSASKDYDGTTNLNYEWVLIKPEDSNAQLSSYITPSTILTSGTSDPVGTRYVATLKVIDTVKTDDEYFHVDSVAIVVKAAPPFDCTMDAITPTTINENAPYTSDEPTFSGEGNPTGNWTYTIDPTTAPFSVVSSTGVITMTAIDYEAGITTYAVTLTATDQASPANVINKTLTITITNVVDVTPSLTDPQPSSPYTVSEDAAVGYVLGSLTISANDSDASGTTIALTGTGSGNFEVIKNGTTSNWELKVKAGATLDFETTESYSLTATASNGIAGSGTPVAVTINVTNVVDITPVLTAPGTNFSVAENAADGFVLGSLTISANDSSDSGTAITLSETGNENFEVTNDSGTWNLKVKAGATLDYETTQTYNLKAEVSNGSVTGNKVDMVINVTNVVDVTPVLTAPASNFTVAEDAAVGFVLGSLTISANDENDSGTAITLSETGSGNFEVTKNGTTWELKVKAGATLDFETITSYALEAEVSNGSLTGNKVNVVINVTNAAEITGITLDTPANLTYFPGASIQFIVSYDADVTVNDAGGKPAINLHIGSDDLGFIDTGKAEYNSALTTAHNVSTDIVFEYIVGSADDHTDIDGIEITDLSIKLNSGTIEDASNNDASLDFTNITIPVLTKVLVDAKMWNIMTGAGFIYIPTWDVNSDGTKEPGFWIAKYEAKDAGSSITIPSKTLRGYMSETFNVYNPTNKDFDQKLCSDGTTGTHSGTTPAIGTGAGDGRQSAFSVANLDTFGFSLNKVDFVKENAPLADINAVEAALILEDSQITDGEEIKLPTSMQWEQVVGLIINNKANWSHAGTILNGEDPTSVHEDMTSLTIYKIFNGHSLTDGPAVSADIDINGYTGLPEFNKYYRRTLVVANDISVRDYKNTPIVDSDDVSVKVNDPAVASNYAAVIWDFSGNVSEWTRELVAANAETGQGGSVGGDIFMDGESEWNEFNNTIQTEAKPSYFMPTWFEPRLSSNIRTNDSKGFGRYNDGDSNTGTPCSYEYGSTTPIDFGYGTNNDNTLITRDGGFAALYRGGSYENNGYDFSGLNLLSAGVSPAYRAPFIGFRAASSTQKGTKGIEAEK